MLFYILPTWLAHQLTSSSLPWGSPVGWEMRVDTGESPDGSLS